MVARKLLVAFAALELGVGIMASVATAFPPCGHRACSDTAAASGLSGRARAACVRQVIADCTAGLCSCTGGSPPCSCVCGDGLCGPSEDCATCPQDCGPCPTTTTSTTTTTTSSCPPATVLFCGTASCGGGVSVCGPPGSGPFLCPPGMTCTATETTCGCTGATILCGDPRLSGATCNFCQWGTCPPGMTCGGVPRASGCGFDCACH